MADVISGQPAQRMWCSVPEQFQLHLAMLALQFSGAGLHVIARATLNMGISKIVFVVYRNIIGLLVLLPFAYFLEKKERPRISLNFLIQFFILGLVGITANQTFYILGLDNTSPTFVAAIQNSVPAITFLMATILGIEKVRMDRKDGLGKVFGTALCVVGASVITLFKGPSIYTPTPPLQATDISYSSRIVQSLSASLGDAKGKNWTLGCLCLIGHCLSWSGWLVMQAPVLRKYPARLSVLSYTTFFGLMQFLVISAFIERDPKAWLSHSGGEAFGILYAGVVASGMAFTLQTWCIDRGGPVLVAVYQPLTTLIVAIVSSIALGEEFYLGGIIGAVLMVVGLYLVLWGKNEERKYAIRNAGCRTCPTPPTIKTSLTQPLLPPSAGNV